MRRALHPDEVRLWRAVASTVEPAPGRALPEPPREAGPPPAPAQRPSLPPRAPQPPARRPSERLHGIEPNRERRIHLGREALGARLDLHGMDQDRAHGALVGFLERAQAEGHRAVLVITGRGRLGGGVLRRRLPDWLAQPPLRAIVAGLSHARRRHGGEGAFYIALKRRSEP